MQGCVVSRHPLKVLAEGFMQPAHGGGPGLDEGTERGTLRRCTHTHTQISEDSSLLNISHPSNVKETFVESVGIVWKKKNIYVEFSKPLGLK